MNTYTTLADALRELAKRAESLRIEVLSADKSVESQGTVAYAIARFIIAATSVNTALENWKYPQDAEPRVTPVPFP